MKPIAFILVLVLASWTLWHDPNKSLADYPPNDRRVLLVAVEGFDWDYVEPLLAAGQLPNLAKLRDHLKVVPIAGGADSPLAPPGMHPPKTWASIFTGHHPASHSVQLMPLDVTNSYDEIPITSIHRRKLALWEILSGAGIKSAVVGNWGTWPAEWVNGYLVSDRYLLSAHQLGPFGPAGHPDFGTAGSAYAAAGSGEFLTYPDELTEELQSAAPNIDQNHPFVRDLDVLQQQEVLPELQAALAMVRSAAQTDLKVTELLQYLLKKDSDIAFASCTFNAFDVAMPLFLKYLQPRLWLTHGNPRVRAQLDPNLVPRYQDIVTETVQFLDEQIGMLLQAMGPDTTLVLVSGHGFEPHFDPYARSMNLNPVLERLGLLTRADDGSIDWNKTSCFDREMQPWRIIRLLSLNFQDQYPQGIVPPPASDEASAIFDRWKPILQALDSVTVSPSWQHTQTGTMSDSLFFFKAPVSAPDRRTQFGVFTSFPAETMVTFPNETHRIPIDDLFPLKNQSAIANSEGFVAFALPGEEGERLAARHAPMGQEFASRVWVAPTILSLFGLPLGTENIEMDDKALLWLLDPDKAQKAAIRRIQSYERTIGRFEPGTPINERYRQMKDHLLELGYVTIANQNVKSDS